MASRCRSLVDTVAKPIIEQCQTLASDPIALVALLIVQSLVLMLLSFLPLLLLMGFMASALAKKVRPDFSIWTWPHQVDTRDR